MTYNYKNRVLTFDDKLIKDYEEYVSYAPLSDMDIEYAIRAAGISTPSAIADDAFAKAIAEVFRSDVEVMTETA